MLAGAVRTYVERYAVRPGSRAVVFTNNDSAYATALALHGAGRRGRGDRRSACGRGARRRAAARRARRGPADRRQVRDRRRARRVACRRGRRRAARRRQRPAHRLRSRRAVRRLEPRGPSPFAGPRQASLRRHARDLRSRRLAGADHAGRRGQRTRAILPRRWRKVTPRGSPPRCRRAFAPLRRSPRRRPFPSRAERRSRCGACRATTKGGKALRRLAERRHRRRHRARRARRLPVGRASEALHDARHGHRPGQGVQHRRPRAAGGATRTAHRRASARRRSGRPTRPVALGAFPGIDAGTHVEPTRYSAIHDWHVAHGARFVNAGLWKRPHSYPRTGESADDAAAREARNVRVNVGIVDVSTLGKIELQGQRRRGVPESRLHQPLGHAPGRPLPLRRDAARRRHRVRRRHDVAPRAVALPDDDDDGERRQGPAAPRNAAAGRMAGARRLRDVGHRAMGRRGAVRPGRAATCSRRSSTSTFRTRRFRFSPSARATCAPPPASSPPGSSG